MTGVLAGQTISSARENDNSSRTTAYTAITANAALNSGVETVYITTPTILFRNNRAFRVTAKGRWNPTAANDQLQIGVRKTNASTTPKLMDTFRISSAGTGTYSFFYQTVIINTSGGDISVPLVATCMRASGTSVTVQGSTADPSYLMVEDIGPASDYPAACSMT